MSLVITVFWNLVGLLAILGAIAFLIGLLDQRSVSNQRWVDPESRRDRTPQSGTSPEQASRTESNPESAASPSARPTDRRAAEIDQPQIPLATSLTVSEVIDPAASPVAVEAPEGQEERGDILISEAMAPGEPRAVANAHHALNLLEEMDQLEESNHSEKLEHLSQYLNDPDSLKRLASVVALNQLAHESQGQNRLETVSLLNRFTSDADPQVRLQAATALSQIRLPDMGAIAQDTAE